ncbi:hypothetical protein BJF78_03960 [Pseudonocardia sp. CNS-139]|nr:hypothetical protein BJF78_03960 [Pseudonocardia sp. CNS-139]
MEAGQAVSYHEYDPSAPYLHLLSVPVWGPLRERLAAVLAGVDPAAGTVLELGPGSGLGTEVVLDTVPDAPVLAAEPSAALRAVLLARLSGRPDAARLSVYPGGAAAVPLPDRIAAVVGLHMVGHLAPGQRARLWPALAARLAPGAPVVLNVQPPDTAVAVPEFPPMSVTVGRFTYQGTGSAEPTGPDSVHWRMRYATLDGDTVLDEARAEYDWWILSAAGLAAELAAAGLAVESTEQDVVVARR